MATVLCIGGSEALHTRNLVLQSAGFDVAVATTKAAAFAALSATAPRAVILDSSSTPHSPHLATELKRVRPKIPVLLVADSRSDDVQPEIDRVISRLDGPVVLLQTLRELTSGAVDISRRSRQSASRTRAQSQNLRERLRKMNLKLIRLNEVLNAARNRH